MLCCPAIDATVADESFSFSFLLALALSLIIVLVSPSAYKTDENARAARQSLKRLDKLHVCEAYSLVHR